MGIYTVIISTEPNPVLSGRAHKLKIRCFQDCQNKRTVLESTAREKNVSLTEVAFIGNDVNDLFCLECVAFPIVVKDAHSDVVPVTRYQTQSPGRHGAVREICDLFERCQFEVLGSASRLP